MRAAVLCAGLGTRLAPLSARWPKPALPWFGAPLFRYALATLGHAGLTSVAINTHHLPEVMAATAHAECARAGVPLEVVHEAGLIQGTGGGLRGLRAALDGGDFLVLNGDVFCSLALEPVVRAHRASGAAATMVLLPMPEGERYNAVEADRDGWVRRIAGHGPGGEWLTPWHFTGLHVMTPSVFEFMAPTGPEDINHDVYPRMLEAGLRIRAHRLEPAEVFWSDLGTPRRYLAAQEAVFRSPALAFGSAEPFPGAPARAQGVWAHAAASAEGADLRGPAWLGAGCVVEAGAVLGASVTIGPGARIGARAQLTRVAVLDGAWVPAGAVLSDVIVAPGGVLVDAR